ncbi:hypothetical protein M569_16735 [Genlisea aurea]|uniref:Uncharacterized protein n=1 Tax=Genlisea aurea TaxID=192259 RepID=S8C0V3_9LAMI|nr:hypothetical protein M569_16735 [Genlisea aurea]
MPRRTAATTNYRRQFLVELSSSCSKYPDRKPLSDFHKGVIIAKADIKPSSSRVLQISLSPVCKSSVVDIIDIVSCK